MGVSRGGPTLGWMHGASVSLGKRPAWEEHNGFKCTAGRMWAHVGWFLPEILMLCFLVQIFYCILEQPTLLSSRFSPEPSSLSRHRHREGATLLMHLLALFGNAGHVWPSAGFLIPELHFTSSHLKAGGMAQEVEHLPTSSYLKRNMWQKNNSKSGWPTHIRHFSFQIYPCLSW
jgi:hypothetical protein